MWVRRATLVDAAALAAVEKTQPYAAGWGTNGFSSELVQPCAIIWCAISEEKQVGFCAARMAADTAEILNVAVLPAYAHQGIGTALLTHTLDDLQRAGVCQISLEVAQENQPACGLYTKVGFKQVNIRKDFYGPGKHAWILGKTI